MILSVLWKRSNKTRSPAKTPSSKFVGVERELKQLSIIITKELLDVAKEDDLEVTAFFNG